MLLWELWNLFVVTVQWSFYFLRVSLYTLPIGCIACFSHVITRLIVAVGGLLVDTRPPTLSSKAIPIGDFFRLMSICVSLCMFRFVLFHSLLNDSGQLNLIYSLKKDTHHRVPKQRQSPSVQSHTMRHCEEEYTVGGVMYNFFVRGWWFLFSQQNGDRIITDPQLISHSIMMFIPYPL